MQRKLTFVLLVLVCLGLPAIVVSQLVFTSLPEQIASGDQPGGPLAGRVLNEHGVPVPDHTVELHSVLEGGGPARRELTKTDAVGAFRFDATPVAGHYVLYAGGGEYQRVAHAASFLDKGGEAHDPGPLELELPPGCTLAVELVRADDRAVTGGVLYLDGRIETDRLFGLFPTLIRLEREFPAGTVVIDGLPTLRGTVRVELASGERVEFEAKLETGRLLRRFEL